MACSIVTPMHGMLDQNLSHDGEALLARERFQIHPIPDRLIRHRHLLPIPFITRRKPTACRFEVVRLACRIIDVLDEFVVRRDGERYVHSQSICQRHKERGILMQFPRRVFRYVEDTAC